MAQININVPNEMKVQLESEGNYSELIRSLIRDHFQTKGNLNEKLNLLEQKSKLQIELIEKQKEKILERIEIKDKQDQHFQEVKDYRKEKEQELDINITTNFEFFAGRPITDEELKEFKERMEEINLVQFVEEKFPKK